jgi:hypothetical protein
VQVTKADGSLEVKTLGELGITEIDLTADATEILLPDGSAISGQSSFVMNGVTRVLAKRQQVTGMAQPDRYGSGEARQVTHALWRWRMTRVCSARRCEQNLSRSSEKRLDVSARFVNLPLN